MSANADYMAVFVTINNTGMMINAGVNVKTWLIKLYAIKGLFRILVTVKVNMTNLAMLVNILTMKKASAGKIS